MKQMFFGLVIGLLIGSVLFNMYLINNRKADVEIGYTDAQRERIDILAEKLK